MKEANTKDKLLSAAAKLFRRQGYHATSLSQITKESNAPRGSIYYYFPRGKEQLAEEAIRKTGENIKNYIESSLASHEDAALAIHHHIRKKALGMMEREKETTDISLVAISREVWASSEILRQACENVYEDWIQVYANKLMSSGYEPEEAQHLGVAIQAWIEGAYALSLSKNNISPMFTVSEQVLNLLNKNK
ncbi:TetR/AcrR family transcriptional regulator [Bacillus cereus group sp. TH152-1LC]|uniref:TetR/AcrR family transcriptional regulator n=1 Tax=Bacillus cereus group sp. TH152-1LC TaxID=3018060 RepID=UPI0022E4A3D2|nr:TetR/AcrR family transcriptional regulator [Bacillus cereus group sp. TH152-1LC]MDA1680478.1 TetR/AcrR family transcriptional regulator [Bacillus cereus group sp. TH152-1LC]